MEDDFTKEYLKELDNDPEYSLEVDPLNKYSFSEENKSFIKNYIQFKNVPFASKMSGIEVEIGEMYFISYNTQQEIRRINKALVQRQFASKMMTLNDIGGYLTSLITDENVPLSDRLKTKDKIEVVKLLIELNDMKNKYIEYPGELINRDIEDEVKELSVTTIKQLLNSSESNSPDNKKDVVNELNKDNKLSPEELSYLESLPTKDLLTLIDEENKKK